MDLLKIGKYIQAQRKAAGMTQKQLAQRLKARKTAAERTSALYPKLGLLGGAAVFLMLI